MIEIKDLLSRFNNIILSEEGKIKSIGRVISEIIGVKINPEDIKVKNNIIYLNIKPIYKSEILVKQSQIFLELRKLFNKKTPQKIR